MPNDFMMSPFAAPLVGGTFTGKWDAPEGNSTTLAAQIDNIMNQRTYINFHTVQYGGGEIRGHLIPEPSTVALAGLGLIGLGCVALRRRTRIAA